MTHVSTGHIWAQTDREDHYVHGPCLRCMTVAKSGLFLACSMNVKEVLENDPGAYFIHDELLAPLKVMYSSLQETGDDSIANARLLDCLRQV